MVTLKVASQQTFVLMKTSWRCLPSSSSEDVSKTSSRGLDQDEYIRFSLMSSKDIFKTSWWRLIYSSWPYVFKTSSRHFQNVFKTSSRRLAKTSSRRLGKASSRTLQDVLQIYLQDVFKAYHQVKLFLLTRLWEVFNMFLRCSFPKTVIYIGICLGNTTCEKFLVSIQNLQER